MDRRTQSKIDFESLCFRKKAIELQYGNHPLPLFVQNIMDHLIETIRQESKKHRSQKMIPFGIEMLETYYNGNDSRRAALMLSTVRDRYNQYDYTIYRVDNARKYAQHLFRQYPPVTTKPAKVTSQSKLTQDYLPGFTAGTGCHIREE